ncbi:MAG: hypothetical protein H0W73_01400 [Bacteroidetes bacterium]|nr:hypothetical protein [Bacteroidota bacterium]
MKFLFRKYLLLIAILIVTNNYGQLLRGLDKKIIDKANFNKAQKNVKENENRFFYKKSNSVYIFGGTDIDLDADNKSYMDISLSNNKDTLKASVFTYQVSSKSYIQSHTIHGAEGNKRNVYLHIKNDLFVALEDSVKKIDSLLKINYILYNKNAGVYFHGFFYRLERERLNSTNDQYIIVSGGEVSVLNVSTTYGEKYYYVNGCGLFKKTKKEGLSKDELEKSKHPRKNFTM